MMKIQIFILLLITSCWLNGMFYEDPGVRNAAMGETGIASTIDVSASVWNPALLSLIQSIEIATDHRKYFWDLDNDDLIFNFAAFSFPLANIGTFAFSGNQFDSNLYQERRIGFHYGNSIFSQIFSFGFSVHYYNINYGQNEFTVNDPFFVEYGYSKDAFDVDLGLAYQINRSMKIGVVATNLLKADLAFSDDNEDKLSGDFGVGFNYQLTDKLLTVFDIVMITNNSLQDDEIKFNGGMEYKLYDILALRSGLNTKKLTTGFGLDLLDKQYINKYYSQLSSEEFINIKSLKITLDYCFQYSFSELEKSFGDHYIGIKIDFSNSTDKVKKLSAFVPPKTEYVTKIKADSLALQNIDVDTMEVAEKVIVDTVFLEKTIWDTIITFSGIPDSIYLQKVKELNSLKVKYEQVRNNNKAQIHLLNSLEQFFAGNYDVAITECKSAITIAPDITLSYIRLGSIYYKIGDLSKAKYNWNKAKRMDPDNPEVKKIKKYLNKIE